MTEDRKFYVYVIFDLNGIPRYVGKGAGRRWNQHESDVAIGRHHNHRLAAIFRRAGNNLPKVKISENLSNTEACQIERAFIAVIGRGRNGPLFNMTDGGEGAAGRKLSPESKAMAGQRSGAARIGKKYGPMSPERRAAISAAKRGCHVSAEVCAARSAAQKGIPKSVEWRAAIAAGMKRSWDKRKSNSEIAA